MRRAELSRLAPPPNVLAWGAVGAVVVVFALFVPASGAFLLTTAAVYAILALSLLPILGGVGMLSMCQLAFAAVGAATMGSLAQRVPFLVAIVLAALAAVPVGLLVGAISLRLRGVSFAAASLGLAATVQVVIAQIPLPGFQSSQTTVPPSPIDTTRGYLFFVLAALGAVSLLVWWARSSRMGRAWTMTRFSERAAAATGVSVPGAKLTATAFGAAIAGLGGALMVGQYGFITADAVTPVNGLILLAVAMVSGVARVAGAWLAGLLFVIIPWWLTDIGLPSDVAVILFGVAAVQVLATGRDGITGQVAAIIAARARARRPRFPVDATLLDRIPGRTDGLSRADLVVERLSVAYGGVRAVDEVDLRVATAAVTGLIGPNGAGKSTLIDAVSGFVRSYEGRVVLGEMSIDGLTPRGRARAGVRRTFQQSRVPRELTVEEYLRLCAGGPLPAMTLGETGDVRLGDLDTPARRIVEVVGAMCADVRVVLLDEPAAGLSADDSLALGAAIARAAERLDIAVLIVEHDVDLVRAACSSLYVLDFGRVIGSGDPARVLSESTVVAAYLGGEPDAG